MNKLAKLEEAIEKIALLDTTVGALSAGEGNRVRGGIYGTLAGIPGVIGGGALGKKLGGAPGQILGTVGGALAGGLAGGRLAKSHGDAKRSRKG